MGTNNRRNRVLLAAVFAFLLGLPAYFQAQGAALPSGDQVGDASRTTLGPKGRFQPGTPDDLRQMGDVSRTTLGPKGRGGPPK